MRTTIVTRYVGQSLLLVASMMLVSAGVAFLDNEDDSMLPLFFSAAVAGLTGAFPMIFARANGRLSVTEGYYIVVISWLACCIFGMIPYIYYSNEFSLTDSLFESVSGFTTTGASIIQDIESLPKGLLFWRKCTCWIGGIGIVTLFSLIIPRNGDAKSILRGAELSDIVLNENNRRDGIVVKTILAVYVLLTLLCSVSLKLTGLDWFDSVTTAMSTCSTCGFGVLNDSIYGYHNVGAEIVLIVFMAISGMNFISLFSLFKKSLRKRAQYETVITYLALIVAGTLLIFVDLIVNGSNNHIGDTLREAAFQFTSIITTTGFATTDTSIWPDMSILILITGSVICGCSGSTSGGIKLDRAIIMAMASRNEIIHLRHPNRVLNVSVNGRNVSGGLATHTFIFLACYLGLTFLGAMINIACGLDITTGISAAIACIGNVGPGFGNVGSFGNYADVPELAKISNTLLMLFGRLEIFPILFVLNNIKHK